MGNEKGKNSIRRITKRIRTYYGLMKLQVGERANFDGITVSIAVAGALRPLSSYPATASVMKRGF